MHFAIILEIIFDTEEVVLFAHLQTYIFLAAAQPIDILQCSFCYAMLSCQYCIQLYMFNTLFIKYYSI